MAVIFFPTNKALTQIENAPFFFSMN